MDVSAEAADVVVRESIQATEAAAKLALEGMKNVAALLLAIAKQDMKVVGQTTAKRLARDPAPAVVIPIKAEDKAKFQKLAKEFGVLYFFAQKKGNDNGMLNVVSNENYAALLSGAWCCDYLSVTGHRRPCPPGEGCTVRKEGGLTKKGSAFMKRREKEGG